MYKILVSTVAALSCITPALASIQTQPIEYRLSYEQFQIPEGVKPMGVFGIHALVDFTPNWYGGLGFYGSVKGESGGYFAMSLDGGYQHPIKGALWLDLGGHVGAGGGRHTAVGGGLFVEPHAGLAWHFKTFNLGANYSWIKYTDGNIKSQQIGLTLSFPTDAHYAPFSNFGNNITLNPNNIAELNKSYMAILGQIYFPNQGTQNTSGTVSDNTTEFVGAEYGQFFANDWFSFANMTGAFHGRGNGYANAFLGVGWHYPLTVDQRFNVIVKLGVGSGGGGAVNTGGGLLIEPTLGLEYLLTPHVALEADGSYLTAPEGDFTNKIGTLALKYYFNNDLEVGAPTTYKGWRLSLANETYFKPKSDTGAINPNMQLMNLNFDYFLNKNWYFSSQIAFAYKGQNTGGYFSGLIGPGVQYPIYKKLSIYAEGLLGTAGGAGLDISDGALGEPVIGLNYQISMGVGIFAGVGRLIAFNGNFSSTTLNIGLNYRIATL